jgi:hypothetical protein
LNSFLTKTEQSHLRQSRGVGKNNYVLLHKFLCFCVTNSQLWHTNGTSTNVPPKTLEFFYLRPPMSKVSLNHKDHSSHNVVIRISMYVTNRTLLDISRIKLLEGSPYNFDIVPISSCCSSH